MSIGNRPNVMHASCNIKMAVMCNSWEEARDRLRKLREEQSRKSDEVIELWRDILADFSYKLGSEEWVVFEQVCIAACDCGELELAEGCYKSLQMQFPGSMRVRYLYGLILEASGCYADALDHYTELLKEDETNSLVRKRKVALLRSQNKIVDAIKELNDYLQKYMSDGEAWLELCDLYLLELDYAKAAFCMEELLLVNPYNHLLHQKYAEIRYTQGNSENIELARKYFAQALKLNPNNTRALFGFYLSANYLAQKAASSSGSKAKKDRNAEYVQAAMKQISEKYGTCYEASPNDSKSQSSQMLALKGMFDSMQISQS